MPSTTSIVVSRVLPSSTVMTPSLPTFSMASAMMSPITWSLLAEMAATLATSALPLTSLDWVLRLSLTAVTAARMPRASAIASAPLVRLR